MRAVIRTWLVGLCVCLGVGSLGRASAAPTPPEAREHLRLAKQAEASGDYDQALAEAGKGLAIAPGDLELLRLKGKALYGLREYVATLEAYEAYLAANPTGVARRDAMKMIDLMRVWAATLLEVTVTDGPVSIYLDSKTLNLFCTAAPSCKKAVKPGVHRVIAERPGFQPWSGNVTVQAQANVKLPITMVEKPSLVTVRATPAGARVSLDDAEYSAPVPVAAGPHVVVVTLDGHGEERREITAHQGAPIDLDVELKPLPPPPPPKPVAVAPPPPPPKPAGRTRKLVGIGVAAAGGVALAAGLVFGAKARSTYDDVKALCGGDLHCESRPDFDRGHALFEDAQSQARMSTWLVAGGSAAIVAGAIVWFTAPKEHDARTVRVVPDVNGQGVGLAVTGGF